MAPGTSRKSRFRFRDVDGAGISIALDASAFGSAGWAPPISAIAFLYSFQKTVRSRRESIPWTSITVEQGSAENASGADDERFED